MQEHEEMIDGPDRPRYNTPIPKEIMTPPVVSTELLGDLKFIDGCPTPDTADTLFKHLDYIHAVQAFLVGVPAASMVAMRHGMEEVRATDGYIAIFQDLMNSNTLFLTPNTESIYCCTWLDLKDGPIVVESPPNTLGMLNDMWFRYVTDLGNAGPDDGKGGTFVFFPPTVSSVVVNEYQRENPDHFAFRSPTFGNSLLWRAFVDSKGSPDQSVADFKAAARIYPLGKAHNEEKFCEVSGSNFNTIHANNAKFFEELHQVVTEEPVESMDPETLGLFASIGIKKGDEFPLDDSMVNTYKEAAAVGNGIARSLTFASRDPASFIYRDIMGREASQWKTAFVGGSHEFIKDGCRLLDARTLFYYYATYVTPAMVKTKPGPGSVYAYTERDIKGTILNGNQHYSLELPTPLPASDFWSIVVYDMQTRSMLQTLDNRLSPSINSLKDEIVEIGGKVTIHFGPERPESVPVGNFIQTRANKCWNTILRLYGPEAAWFEKTWMPGEIVQQA